ncbi:MAG: RNA methyltransferase [Planctomycetaceae bacterium]
MNETPRYHRELCSHLAGFLSEHKRELLPRLLLNRTRHITVVVEDIHKEHNASACLRSCDCFGIQDVHIVENYNEYTGNREVSLGAEKWLTLSRFNAPDQDNTTRCLESLRERGYRIVMTSPHAPTCDLPGYDASQPTALLFGNEKNGVSDRGRELADDVMRIPMYGFSESFNISVAAAVALNHLVYQMRQQKVAWQLSEVERDEILLAWVRASSGRKRQSLEDIFRSDIWNDDQAAEEAELWPDWSAIEPAPQLERKAR